MKRILAALSQKWPEYLIEAIVIIASILGAYSLDNWNEERKIRASEKVILQNLRTEILANKIELQNIHESHLKSNEGGFELLNLFGKDISSISTKRLDTLLGNVESAWTFDSRSGYMKSIIASGKIDYLRNDELKSMITSFDGQVTDATQEIPHIHKLVSERLWPEIDGKINSINRITAIGIDNLPNSQGSYESDYTWFFKSRVLEDIISNILSWFYSVLGDEQELMDFLNSMLNIIDQEIIKQDE